MKTAKKTVKRALFLLFTFTLFLAFSSSAYAKWKTTKNGRRYYTSSNKYVKSSWKKIKNNWFYFDENGFEVTGRFKVDGSYYYCEMYTGRVTKKKVGKYYYNSKGVMVQNKWVRIKKHYYYFGKNGKVRYGSFVVDGNTYYCLKDTGRVTSTWYQKHYYDENGVMAANQWVNGSYVNQDGDITKGNQDPINPPTEKEIRLLSAIVYLEAGNQSYYGKKCVASVVVNRMQSKLFPDTIYDVIYQSGQFSPAMNGSLDALYYSNATIPSSCIKATKYVLSHGSILKDYYYFNNFYGTLKIGDHYFS